MKEEYDFLKGRKNPYKMTVDKCLSDSDETIVTKKFEDEYHDLNHQKNNQSGK